MATIGIEGMQFTEAHGFYDEEQQMGTNFIVDVYIETVIKKAAEEDDLYKTINYELVYLICKSEMSKGPYRLLETLTQNMHDRIKDHFETRENMDMEYVPPVYGVKVRLRKLNPPFSGPVDSTYIEVKSGVFNFPSLDALKTLKDFADDLDDLEEMEDV